VKKKKNMRGSSRKGLWFLRWEKGGQKREKKGRNSGIVQGKGEVFNKKRINLQKRGGDNSFTEKKVVFTDEDGEGKGRNGSLPRVGRGSGHVGRHRVLGTNTVAHEQEEDSIKKVSL